MSGLSILPITALAMLCRPGWDWGDPLLRSRSLGAGALATSGTVGLSPILAPPAAGLLGSR